MKRAVKRLALAVLAPLAPLTWRWAGGRRLLVLMYHRVLPADHPDRRIEQPGMYVSPATLEMHIQLLKRHFTLVHLDDWVRAAGAGERLPARACALTFDDGWRDNFEHAFPVLQRQSAPATIFLVTGMTGTSAEFWPNRLARRLAQLGPDEVLPEPLGSLLAPVVAQARGAGRWSLEDLDRAVVLAKQLGDAQVRSLLETGVASGIRAVLNDSEIRAMAATGLVRFGSHTRTHCRLRGELSPEVLESEIAGSRIDVKACAGNAGVGIFCYPNGDMTPAAVAAVRAHYLAAVTTQRGWHDAAADPHLIRRIGVHEDISSRPAGLLARIAGFS